MAQRMPAKRRANHGATASSTSCSGSNQATCRVASWGSAAASARAGAAPSNTGRKRTKARILYASRCTARAIWRRRSQSASSGSWRKAGSCTRRQSRAYSASKRPGARCNTTRRARAMKARGTGGAALALAGAPPGGVMAADGKGAVANRSPGPCAAWRFASTHVPTAALGGTPAASRARARCRKRSKTAVDATTSLLAAAASSVPPGWPATGGAGMAWALKRGVICYSKKSCLRWLGKRKGRF